MLQGSEISGSRVGPPYHTSERAVFRRGAFQLPQDAFWVRHVPACPRVLSLQDGLFYVRKNDRGQRVCVTFLSLIAFVSACSSMLPYRRLSVQFPGSFLSPRPFQLWICPLRAGQPRWIKTSSRRSLQPSTRI